MTTLVRPPTFEPVLVSWKPLGLLAYPAAVMADNPLHYWRLGEAATANSDVYDQAAGLTGLAVAKPTRGVSGITAGDPDTAYTFATGTTQYVNLAGYTTPPNPGTIEAWVRGEDFNDMGVAGWFDSGALASMYLLITSVGVQLRFICGNNTNDCNSNTTGILDTSGPWHQIAGTYDGSASRLYLDGALVAGPITKTGPAGVASGAFKIANYGNPSGTAFNGSIDEVSVYGTALSTARILAHYNAAGY